MPPAGSRTRWQPPSPTVSAPATSAGLPARGSSPTPSWRVCAARTDHEEAPPMATRRPLIALIPAGEASMAPAVAAFEDEFPDAELWHLLDTRLVTDADDAGGLTPPLHDRMTTLIQYAVDG